MSVIAIIPARGGSKRIPRKNIKHFLGMPIIAYSITAALKSGVFDEVMVSTDDVEISDISKEYGASVPFFRSNDLSSDIAATAPVLIEALGEYEKRGKIFEYVCCLYPCAPFITPKRLVDGMGLLIGSNADSVMPVVKFSYPPQRCLVIRDGVAAMLHPENYNMRSQDLEPLYHDAGQFYFLKSSSLKNEKKLFCKNTLPLILPDIEVQDIDSEEDWTAAEIKFQILKGIR